MQVSLQGLEQVLGCPPRLQAQPEPEQEPGHLPRLQALVLEPMLPALAQPEQVLVPARSPRLQVLVLPVWELRQVQLEPARARLGQRKPAQEPALRPAPWLSLGPEQLQGLLAELALEPEL